MDKNNKTRILLLIEILRKYSNSDKHLKINEIISLLENKGLKVDNRKTLYDDFKILNNSGFNVEYDNGYYLLEAPFNLSEIKIIQDSIYSLKSIDNRLLNELNNKLYSFISYDEEKLLESLKYSDKHKDKKFLERMEDILEAIKTNKAIIVKRQNNKKEEVFPVFVYRKNDYYYFYYHYENSEKLYHFRFDNISDIRLLDKKDILNIKHKDIIETIEASSNSYFKEKANIVLIKILKDTGNIKQRIIDDFPNAVENKDGFSIKISINDIFFSKLLAYGPNIKIINKDIATQYKKYLKEVLAIYHKND